MIKAEDLACAVEGWAGEVATGGDVDLIEDGFSDRALEIFGGGGEDAVGARESVGDTFAHVTDDDLEVGQAVENSSDDKTQEVEAEFGVPAPTGDG